MKHCLVFSFVFSTNQLIIKVIFRGIILPKPVMHSFHWTAATVFSRIIAGDEYFFFRTEKGRLFEGRRLFEGGDYFIYCPLEVVP